LVRAMHGVLLGGPYIRLAAVRRGFFGRRRRRRR
jgi:hypothetical protein